MGLETESNNYSIQFSWPLVAGGIAHSKRREAYANYDKAKEQTKYTTRSVIQDIKSKHSSLLTAKANVQAREQAFKSAESALIATEYGFEANTRNIIDLLNAQRNVFAAERDYASAKYDFILSDVVNVDDSRFLQWRMIEHKVYSFLLKAQYTRFAFTTSH